MADGAHSHESYETALAHLNGASVELHAFVESMRNSFGLLAERVARLEGATPSEPPTPVPAPKPEDGRIGYGAGNRSLFNGTTTITGGDPANLANLHDALRDGARVLLEQGLSMRVPDSLSLGDGAQILGLGRGSEIIPAFGSGHTIDNRGTRNVRIRNVILYGPDSTDGGAALHTSGGATDFWYDHVTIQRSGDEGFGFWRVPSDTPAKDGTLSYCRIVQDGPSTSTQEGNPGTKGLIIGSNTVNGSLGTRLTLYRTVFRSTQRGPFVKDGGIVHIIEGVNERWGPHGIQVATNGQALIEGHIFGIAKSNATRVLDSSAVIAIRSSLLNGASVVRQNESQVFTPPHAYNVPSAPAQGVYEARIAAAGAGAISLEVT